MRWSYIFILSIFVLACKPGIYLQKGNVKLSNPVIYTDDVFFEEHSLITISPTAEDAEIRFQVAGGDNQKYKNPFILQESSKIIAQAIGGGYMASDTSEIEVVKLPKNEIISIRSNRELNENYGSEGLHILIDRKKGKADFKKGWLGYLGDTVRFDLEFEVIELDYLIVSLLRNHGAWIFSPAYINVYSDEALIGAFEMNKSKGGVKLENVFCKIPLPKIRSRQLSVELIANEAIPGWHPGKGSKPWIFIDEILIY